MSLIAPDPEPVDPIDPKQAAYDALDAVLKDAAAAANNHANTEAAQDTAFDLTLKTEDQLRALNLAAIAENTVALQAAAAEMTPGMKDLQALQSKIAALGNDLKEGTSILEKIDSAVGELEKLGLSWV